ncbi:MAG: RDD family protein [Nitrospira sp.]|nr:RDD family protein [Nitrospira sp.]
MSEEFKKAGLLLRTVAKILDYIIIAAVAEMVPKAGFFAGLVYLLIGDGLFEGRSLGKKLIGLRVVSADTNKPCTFRDSILRNSPLGVGYLLYRIPWIGWIFILLVSVVEFIILLGSNERKRIGDEIAKTIVIESPQAYKQDTEKNRLYSE